MTRLHRLYLPVLAWALLTCVPVMPARAQVSFAWPAATADVKTYGVVETCVALYRNRFRRMLRQNRSDTLFASSLFAHALSPDIVDDVRRCAESVTVDNAMVGARGHINAVVNTFGMLLAADRTADARALATRWLGSLSPSDEAFRNEGITRFLWVALDWIPTRWDDAWAVVDLHSPAEWINRFSLVSGILDFSYYRAGDTTRFMKAAHWMVQTAQAQGEALLTSPQWSIPKARALYLAQRLVLDKPLMDSLAHGTSSYIRYLGMLGKASGIPRPDAFPHVDSIRADYWFPNRLPTGRPARGAVSIVIATPDYECNDCGTWSSLIKRVHERFPSVELTLIGQTRGYYGTALEPMAPEVEARLIDSVYRVVHRLPVTVAIHRTQFKRVEDPDRRRVNIVSPNANYDTQCNPIQAYTKAHIIDRDGVLVDRFCLKEPYAEWRLGRLLDALVRQQ